MNTKKYISCLNHFCQFKDADSKTVTYSRIFIIALALVCIIIERLSFIPLLILLSLYAIILYKSSRLDDHFYHKRRLTQRITSVAVLSLVLLIYAAIQYKKYIGNPFIFFILILFGDIGLWFLIYKSSDKALKKINYRFQNRPNTASLGISFFAACGVVGTSFGSRLFKGLSSSQADFFTISLIVALAYLISFESSDIVLLALLKKYPGLDEECWKARETLKEKSQESSADRNT